MKQSELVWHPTVGEVKERNLHEEHLVYSYFSQMKKGRLLKFFKKHPAEVVVALTDFFTQNYDEYYYLFNEFPTLDDEELDR